MLHLEPRVHFEEEKRPRVDQELDGADAHVADRLRSRHRGLEHPAAEIRVEPRRRGLFDELLVPPLHGAVTLAESQDATGAVGQHLHLDVPGPRQPPFQVDAVITEGRLGLAARDAGRLEQIRLRADKMDPLPPAPTRGLDEERNADPRRLRDQCVIADRAGPGEHGHPGGGDALPRAGLVAADRQYVCRRPHERQPRALAGAREDRVLGEEAVDGMDRRGSRGAGDLDQRGDVEVALGGDVPGQRVGLIGHGDVGGAAVGGREDGDGA